MSRHMLGIMRDIRDVDNRAIEDCSRREQMPARPGWKELPGSLQGCRRIVVIGYHVDQLAVEPVDRTEETATQLDRMLGDRIKHWLQIVRCTTNNPKNVARGCLLLLMIARLKLFGEAPFFFFELAEFGGARTIFLLLDPKTSHVGSPDSYFGGLFRG